MRTITQGDISLTARAVHDLPEDVAYAAVMRWLSLAHAADLYRKRFGRVHPFWGNGTLAGVVLCGLQPRSEPFPAEERYLQAMAQVIDAILDWRKRG